METSSPNGLVSVIIPTYNDDEFLPRAVESVLSQTYSRLELLIIDSSESRAAETYAKSYSNINHISAPPEGPGAARNIGINESSGEFIAFLDADDEWLPRKISRQIELIEDVDADFVYTEEYVATESEDMKHLPGISLPDDVPPHEYYFRKGTGIGSRTVLVKSKCLESHRFSEDLAAREDPHLWTRLLRECNPAKVSEPLAIKHSRSNSLTSNRKVVWENERKSIEDLTERYAELEQYQDVRLSEADYRYAKRLLQDGQNHQARGQLRKLKSDGNRWDMRVLSLLIISYLPVGHKLAVSCSDWIYQRFP